MRKRNKGRVCVYKDRKKWRVEVTRTDGSRASRIFATEEVAQEVAQAARREIESTVQTVHEAIDIYMAELRARGSVESHMVSSKARLRMIFPLESQWLMHEIPPEVAQRLYDDARTRKSPRTGRPYAVDTHRHALNEARAMCKWLVGKGIMQSNPFASVEGVGKRRKGKQQLTIDEARRFLDACLAYEHPTRRKDGRNKMRASKLDPRVGVTAAMCCLLMAMRAGEIAGLTPRSIDDGGRILRVFRSTTKSDAGERLLEVPDMLQARMPALAAASISRHQINSWCRKLCRVAGVTEVGPHALRGTHASLAMRAGATSHLVAGSLGHAGTGVTERHYMKADAVEGARAGTALTVLAGGRS